MVIRTKKLNYLKRIFDLQNGAWVRAYIPGGTTGWAVEYIPASGELIARYGPTRRIAFKEMKKELARAFTRRLEGQKEFMAYIDECLDIDFDPKTLLLEELQKRGLL